MSELKPCPFCGGEALIDKPRVNIHFWFASCSNYDCGTCGPDRKTREEAIEAWNRRAEIQTQHTHCCPCGAERTCKNMRNDLNQNKEPDAPNNWYAFLCSECGMGQRLQYQNDYCPNCGAKVVE